MRNIEAQSVILGDNCQQWDHEGHFSALQLKLKKGANLLSITCRGGIGNWHIYKEGGLDT